MPLKNVVDNGVNMNRKLGIILLVVATIGITIWLKPQISAESGGQLSEVEKVKAENKVLLFADPREAESSCGCAEVIKTARSTSSIQGVFFKEFDLTQNGNELKKYSVRVSPTIVILDKNNKEQMRFEGETRRVIKGLHRAITSFKNSDSINR